MTLQPQRSVSTIQNSLSADAEKPPDLNLVNCYNFPEPQLLTASPRPSRLNQKKKSVLTDIKTLFKIQPFAQQSSSQRKLQVFVPYTQSHT